MKLVKLANGKYCIKRRFWVWAEYKDLDKCSSYWWSKGSRHYLSNCIGTKEQCIEMLKNFIEVK